MSPNLGLGFDFDPQWYLTDRQKALQARLIEACHDVIRPEAIRCDETGEFSWKSVEALAELDLLGCIVPEKWGGKGENHVGLAMIGEDHHALRLRLDRRDLYDAHGGSGRAALPCIGQR